MTDYGLKFWTTSPNAYFVAAIPDGGGGNGRDRKAKGSSSLPAKDGKGTKSKVVGSVAYRKEKDGIAVLSRLG